MTSIRSDSRARAAQIAQEHSALISAANSQGPTAMIVGNLAGVVEWADEAWTKPTGFPLNETLDKPITHFLDRAGLSLDLVDFVAQHFLDGRATSVEFAFEAFDGRSILVHLRVEPVRGIDGEIERFVAIANETPNSASPEATIPAHEEEVPSAPSTGTARTGSHESMGQTSLFAVIEQFVSRFEIQGGDTSGVDLILDAHTEEDLPLAQTCAETTRRLLDSLGRAALCSAGHEPLYLSFVAGWLKPGRSHVSRVHPIRSHATIRFEEPMLYLEVHDTGSFRGSGETQREQFWDEAAQFAAQAGLSIFFDSTPGCGNQALIALPTSQEPS